MTVRDLIKMLECVDLDKEVAILVSVISDNENDVNVILKDIESLMENENLVAIK